jgi:hypothetical protein
VFVGDTTNRKETHMNLIPTPSQRVHANAINSALVRSIALTIDAGEDPSALIAERRTLESAIFADSFPDAYPAAEVEAARALIVEVTS